MELFPKLFPPFSFRGLILKLDSDSGLSDFWISFILVFPPESVVFPCRPSPPGFSLLRPYDRTYDLNEFRRECSAEQAFRFLFESVSSFKLGLFRLVLFLVDPFMEAR